MKMAFKVTPPFYMVDNPEISYDQLIFSFLQQHKLLLGMHYFLSLVNLFFSSFQVLALLDRVPNYCTYVHPEAIHHAHLQ